MSPLPSRRTRTRRAALLASIASVTTLGAALDSHATATTTATSALAPLSQNITVSFTGWPNISGLTVLANGVPVIPKNGAYTVRNRSHLTVLAAGVVLATLEAKSSITLFDLLPVRECGSSLELGKLLSLLLALDADQDPSNGISIETTTQAKPAVALSALSEASLLSLETQLTGHNVAINTALLTANAALDQETWTSRWRPVPPSSTTCRSCKATWTVFSALMRSIPTSRTGSAISRPRKSTAFRRP